MRILFFSAALLSSTSSYAQVTLQFPDILGIQPNYRLQAPLSEARKNALVVPFKRALTLCVTEYVKTDREALFAFRQNRFLSYVQGLLAQCPRQVEALSARYDQVYGAGTADAFIRGAYLDDLPRAVLARTKSDIQSRLDAYDKEQAVAQEQAREQAERDAVAKRAEDARAAEAAKRQEEEDRAATAKAEAERKTAEAETAAATAKAAQQKREQIDVAKRSFGVLKDKLYGCIDQELPQLVKSGESADVLANAAMTICNRALIDAEDASLDVVAIEEGQKPSGPIEEVFRDKSKAVVKERAIADAVQAKAGVGQFAPSKQ